MVKLTAPTAAALVNALLIALAVIAGLAAVALVVFIAWRVHRWRQPGAARAAALPLGRAQAAQPLPLPLPQAPAIEQWPEVHLHFHGVTPDEVAAIIRREQEHP